MNETPTVFLVDDDHAVRDGLSRLLRSAGFAVESFVTATDFLAGGNDARPGCLVLDVEMPGLTGVELQRVMADRRRVMPILFLSGHGSVQMVSAAMKFGAFDFLAKPVKDEVLIEAIRVALEANKASRAARSALDAAQQLLATLTPREREVLPLVVAGKMNKQIAARLGTAEKTVKVHRARVMSKLNARTLPDLVRLADLAGVSVPGA